ncbi:hypothetical protein IFM89_035394 [Coptis chinensis]|uniref:Smr domain-containing protein n=1 Tax=Coptis chinensis TaxID=261450 RepID=A0A835HH45_9MAGN|nr:hypothetical protein IFM89_035394 [Coptis chinensis]
MGRSQKKKKGRPISSSQKAKVNHEKNDKKEEEEGIENLLSLMSFKNVTGDVASSSSSFEFSSNNSNSDDIWTTSSSSNSSDMFWEPDVVIQTRGKGFGGGNNNNNNNKNKQKRVVASAGSVANVIDKGYVRDSPVNWHGSKKFGGYEKMKGVNKEEAEQFLCSMLGDDCEISMAVVRDVLCQCGYDVEKASDVLLDLSASSPNQLNDGHYGDYSQISEDSRNFSESDDSGEDNLAKYQVMCCTFESEHNIHHTMLFMSDSTFNLSEEEVQQILQSSGYDRRGYLEVLVGPKKHCKSQSTSTETSLPQTVLESLFSIPKRSEHEPDGMNWKNVVKKMESFGPRAKLCAEPLQNTEYVKTAVAATAYSNGQRSYASYLSEQGKVHNKVACVADEKASQEIFEVRNKEIQNTVTIDLHGQHVKQAIRLLKVHLLLFTTYVPSVQILRVITGCGTHGVGKGKLKQSVISLVEKGGIKWTEENKGIVLINLDGQKSFIFEESEDESE